MEARDTGTSDNGALWKWGSRAKEKSTWSNIRQNGKRKRHRSASICNSQRLGNTEEDIKKVYQITIGQTQHSQRPKPQIYNDRHVSPIAILTQSTCPRYSQPNVKGGEGLKCPVPVVPREAKLWSRTIWIDCLNVVADFGSCFFFLLFLIIQSNLHGEANVPGGRR